MVFNFHPVNSFSDYRVGAPHDGPYKVSPCATHPPHSSVPAELTSALKRSVSSPPVTYIFLCAGWYVKAAFVMSACLAPVAAVQSMFQAVDTAASYAACATELSIHIEQAAETGWQ